MVYVIQPQPGDVSSQSAIMHIIDVSPTSRAFGALAVDDFDGTGLTLAIGAPGEGVVWLFRSTRILNSLAIDVGTQPTADRPDGRLTGTSDFGASLATGLLRGSSTRMLAVGAPGTVGALGVTELDGVEAGPVPFALVADTVKV